MSEDVDADVDMSLKTRNTLDTAAFRRSLSIMMEMGWAGMMRFTDRQFIIHHLTFPKKNPFELALLTFVTLPIL